jgi:hypothetical protein
MLIHTEERDGFTISFHAMPEDMDPAEDFTDDQETIDAINSGEFVWFMARVQASKEGIVLGTDYLGACCYKSYMQFVENNDYYADMVKNAIGEARETLAKLCKGE